MRKPIMKIALSILLVAVVLVGGTLAYLVTQTELLTNTFAVVDIDTEIEETPGEGSGSEKKPTVQNNSNVPVYVRAIAVVTTEEGSSVPVSDADVRIKYSYDGTKWVKNGDYYYYTEPVASDASTYKLFDGVEVNITDTGAKFAVYVYHESVEAKDFNWGGSTTPEEKAEDIAGLFN